MALRRYKVFLAFPFDAATFNMYKEVVKKLRDTPVLGGNFDFEFGTDVIISPSPKDRQIESFKAQNSDLFEQFRSKVVASDIVVADLTNDNPNVHVELGIALTLDKNILRVTGRTLERVASDVKGFTTEQYRSTDDLTDKIQAYLKQYLLIKRAPLSKRGGALYKLDANLGRVENLDLFGIEVANTPKHLGVDWFQEIPFQARDFELRVKFKFLWTGTDNDWFGLFFRYNAIRPWNDGYLLYVRKDGHLELIGVPYPRPDEKHMKTFTALVAGREYCLHIMVDGSFLRASLARGFSNPLDVHGLRNQSYGKLALGCFRSQVEYHSLETTIRDTIAFGGSV